MPAIRVIFNNAQIMHRNLSKDVYVIGRHEDCDIHIDNLGISRTHARLVRDGEGYAVEDMNSSNGTYLNGEKIEHQVLRDGDEVVIGKYVITYEATSGETVGQEESDAERATIAQMPGDVLHTMAMDGEAIRKRIEKMQRQKEQEGKKATHPMPAAADKARELDSKAHGIEQAEAKAREAELAQLRSRMKLMTGLAVVIVLAAALAAIWYFVLR